MAHSNIVLSHIAISVSYDNVALSHLSTNYSLTFLKNPNILLYHSISQEVFIHYLKLCLLYDCLFPISFN